MASAFASLPNKMRTERPYPLAQRITLAFTLMTFVVSGAFTLSLVYIMFFVEKELVSRLMSKTLGNVIAEDLSQGRPPRLDHDMQFFASGYPGIADPIPERYSQAREGFSEIGHEWVFVLEAANRRHVLIQDQSEFEVRERIVFGVLFLGFLITVAGAWGLGKLTSKKVMFPVIRLAEQVRLRDPFSFPSASLEQDYADDEIGHLAKTFDDAMTRLALALERERLFTADISHELRTPLMIISTSCELLAHASLSPRERERLDRIACAAEEMRDMSEIFLQLARAHPVSGKAAGTPAPELNARLGAVAEEQCLRWKPDIESKGIRFEFVVEASDPAKYNGTLLRTVMGNLLRNALHYTDSGWIKLVLENGGFRIEDTGIGISEQDKNRVFLPFTRGGQARGEGLGLGLSLVRRICAHQGWRIELSSLPEGGTRFSVRL
ncbi:MAG: HAMP domain-containing histidine kinase [Azoarcus sp.]|jgi:signal transduction histidine kinase|nr:HAMP domain-containing histidine kinase [Azoarcus sp.]